MAVAEELTVLITAHNAQMLTALDDVNKKLGGMGEAAKSAATKTGLSLDEAAKSAAKWGAASTAAAGGAIYLFKQMSDGVEATNNLARSLGMSYEQMVKLQYAAAQTGVEQGALTQGLRLMQRTLGDVATGGGEAAALTLQKLGISMSDLQGLGADQQFAAISTALNGVEDGTVRASMAADIFGRSFGQLMPMMQGDTAALMAEIDQMGGALSDIDVTALDNAGDAIGRVEAAAKLAAQSFAADLAPSIEVLADMTFELITNTDDYGESSLKASDVVKIAMGTVLNVLNVLKGTLQIATAAVMQLGAAGVETFEWMLAGINMVWKPFQTMINGWIQIHNLVFDDAQWPLLGDLDKAVTATENIGDNLHGAAVGLAAKGMESIAAGFRGDASSDFNKRSAGVNADNRNQASTGATVSPTELEEIKSAEDIKAAAKDEAKAAAEAKAHEAEAKRAEEWAEQQRVAALGEEEALIAEYRTKEQTLQEHLDNKLISEESYASASAALAATLNGDLEAMNAKRRAQEEADAKAKLAKQKQEFTSTIGAAAQHNKTFFEMNKAMKLAEAALNLKSSISGAYAVGAQIGGPVVGAAFAVAAGAAQLVNMQAIASASFGGAASGAGGAGAGGGGGGAASPATTAAPAAAAAPAAQRQQFTTVNLQGDVFSRDSVRALFEQLQEEAGDSGVSQVFRVV